MRHYVFFAFLYMDIEFFHKILSVDSTSGKEAELADMLAVELAGEGRTVEVFEVGDGTRNIKLLSADAFLLRIVKWDPM